MDEFLFLTRGLKNIVVPFLRKYKLKKVGFIILITLFSLGIFFWWELTPPSSTGKEIFFVIKRGENLFSIGKRLKEQGLIRNPLSFYLAIFIKGKQEKIQAGSFDLRVGLSPWEIVEILTHGVNDVWVTFPEGWRREEFARRLSSNLENFNEEEFLRLTENLEGYLFPDTYLLPKHASPSALVKIFTKNFEKKVGLISKEELILASIVEREVKHSQDRPIVAGILLKRMRANWPLQVDATVQYAKANRECKFLSLEKCEWWPKVTSEDIKIDSPFNTYKYKGLPPSPICNPGLESIRAVLNPLPTDYWYYLSDEKGIVHFAKTIEEHNQNIDKYLK